MIIIAIQYPMTWVTHVRRRRRGARLTSTPANNEGLMTHRANGSPWNLDSLISSWGGVQCEAVHEPPSHHTVTSVQIAEMY